MPPSDPAPLRVAILGAGAMGSLVGGCLARAGAAVTLLDTDATHLATVARDGLRMTLDDGDHVVPLAALPPDRLRDAPDLVIVLTKQPHTRAALAAIRPVLDAGCPVLTLQNGLGNEEIIAEAVSPDRILLGVTTYPADRPGPGHVSSHGAGEVRLRTADGTDRPLAHRVAALLRAGGQHAVVDPDLPVAIWSKVAFNCAMNGICALTGSRVGDLAAHPAARALAFAVADEVVAVAHAAGVPVDGAHVRATVGHAMAHHGPHKPSMLQDMEAGRPTEIAALNAAVAALADRLGLPAPRTAAIAALVSLAEHPRAERPRT